MAHPGQALALSPTSPLPPRTALPQQRCSAARSPFPTSVARMLRIGARAVKGRHARAGAQPLRDAELIVDAIGRVVGTIGAGRECEHPPSVNA